MEELKASNRIWEIFRQLEVNDSEESPDVRFRFALLQYLDEVASGVPINEQDEAPIYKG